VSATLRAATDAAELAISAGERPVYLGLARDRRSRSERSPPRASATTAHSLDKQFLDKDDVQKILALRLAKAPQAGLDAPPFQVRAKPRHQHAADGRAC